MSGIGQLASKAENYHACFKLATLLRRRLTDPPLGFAAESSFKNVCRRALPKLPLGPLAPAFWALPLALEPGMVAALLVAWDPPRLPPLLLPEPLPPPLWLLLEPLAPPLLAELPPLPPKRLGPPRLPLSELPRPAPGKVVRPRANPLLGLRLPAASERPTLPLPVPLPAPRLPSLPPKLPLPLPDPLPGPLLRPPLDEPLKAVPALPEGPGPTLPANSVAGSLSSQVLEPPNLPEPRPPLHKQQARLMNQLLTGLDWWPVSCCHPRWESLQTD